ncbi:retinol-binding protein 3-like [Clupea harengus]|uniref:Retinol-binding protein 3-like n=1 Tax=Clupea harengus TaxID=7950 RepID=A0A6P3VMD9_CLUHA|nr:retinol-binding protein 3-like [Clupea harengus]
MARALVLLAALLLVGSAVPAARAVFPPSLIMDMAKILLDNYCSPERLVGMEEAIAAASSNTEILSVDDPQALSAMLTEGVKSTIGDPRVAVTYEPGYAPPPAPPTLTDLPPEQVAAMLQGTVKVEVMEGNVGYLRIQHIIGEEMAQQIGPLLIQYVWDVILPTSALVLDLRFTATGELSGIPYIVSYFTDAEPLIHIDTVYDRPSDTTTELMSMPALMGARYGTTKPLVLLTSAGTRGIAEDVAYSLQSLKRATLVGEHTAGGSVQIDKMKVGDTDFYVSVPVAKSTNPVTGKTWEVVGVTPDVEVAAEDALDVALRIINLRAQIPELLQASGALVAENYAFESVGADVSEKLAALAASGEYDMINSKEDLEVKLSADLQKLSGDKSLTTTSNTPALPPMNPTPEMFIELIKVSFHTDILENNIGYLRFDMFGDFEQVKAIAQVVVEHVWNKVVDTDALIVDLRNNVGGPTTSIAGFCSYFFDADKEIVLDKLYDRPTGTTQVMVTLPELTGKRYGTQKSLLILTSGVTAGAAEEFVFIMKRLGRAMIIGETTAGGSHPPVTFRVGESSLFLSIPITHSDTSQGPAWEGAGIAPHIPVPADAALDTAKGILNKHFAGQK